MNIKLGFLRGSKTKRKNLSMQLRLEPGTLCLKQIYVYVYTLYIFIVINIDNLSMSRQLLHFMRIGWQTIQTIYESNKLAELFNE